MAIDIEAAAQELLADIRNEATAFADAYKERLLHHIPLLEAAVAAGNNPLEMTRHVAATAMEEAALIALDTEEAIQTKVRERIFGLLFAALSGA
jgi:hypothetical protein